MIFDNKILIGAFLCLSLCVSCQKNGGPTMKTTTLSDEEMLHLADILPELVTSPYIQYDNPEMGYYISLGEKEFSRTWSVGPVYIPSQSFSFEGKATRVELDDFSGWLANDTKTAALKDVHLPEGVAALKRGEFQSALKLTVSLGENVPYPEVILSDLTIHFPSLFQAENGSPLGESISELKVTAAGASVTIPMNLLVDPFEFTDEDGRRCYSFETAVSAYVTVPSEGAFGKIAGAGMPAELDLQYSLEFDRIDFTRCDLVFDSLPLDQEELAWDSVQLPSFLCGEGSDYILSRTHLLLDFRCDYPFVYNMDVTAGVEDRKAEFGVSDNDFRYMFTARTEAMYREGITEREVTDLGRLFKGPFPGGKPQPKLTFRFPDDIDPRFVVEPGKEYRMSATAEWMLPFYYEGQLKFEGVPPQSFKMDGDVLDAPANSRHRIKSVIQGRLPFDCRITPVFTMEGEAPVFLDDIVLTKADREKKLQFSYEFIPKNDHWKATLHYVISPTNGLQEFFNKDIFYIQILDTHFTANLSN